MESGRSGRLPLGVGPGFGCGARPAFAEGYAVALVVRPRLGSLG